MAFSGGASRPTARPGFGDDYLLCQVHTPSPSYHSHRCCLCNSRMLACSWIYSQFHPARASNDEVIVNLRLSGHHLITIPTIGVKGMPCDVSVRKTLAG